MCAGVAALTCVALVNQRLPAGSVPPPPGMILIWLRPTEVTSILGFLVASYFRGRAVTAPRRGPGWPTAAWRMPPSLRSRFLSEVAPAQTPPPWTPPPAAPPNPNLPPVAPSPPALPPPPPSSPPAAPAAALAIILPLVILGVLLLLFCVCLCLWRSLRPRKKLIHLDPESSERPNLMLARRRGTQDSTPFPALAAQPDPSELTGSLPAVKPPPKPRSMAPVIILAQPAPVPLKSAVPPETAAKIPEAVLPTKSLDSGTDARHVPPSPPVHAPIPAPPLVAPPMPLTPPSDSARVDEVQDWLRAVMQGSSKVGVSRAIRLHAALCDRLDLFDAALSDPTRYNVSLPARPWPPPRPRSSDGDSLANCRFRSPCLVSFSHRQLSSHHARPAKLPSTLT